MVTTRPRTNEKAEDRSTDAATDGTDAELCQLIRRCDFQKAIEHLHKRPDEARVWVPSDTAVVDVDDEEDQDGFCASYDDTAGYSRRRRHQHQHQHQQLPLHIACQMLRSEDNDNTKQQKQQRCMVLLYHLIERLVVLYPDACKERGPDDAGADVGRDGSEKRHGLLPLEQVIANHPRMCPPRLLEIIISAYPEASLSSRIVQYLAEEDEEDSGNENLKERKVRKSVTTDMLRRAQNAVIQSRQDAKLRFLYHHDSPVEDALRRAQNSVIQCRQDAKLGFLYHHDSPVEDAGGVTDTASPPNKLSETESLRVFQDLYRRHDTYSRTVLDLTRERLELQNEIHRLRSVARDEKRILHEEKMILYYDLDDINSDLRRQIARMELALRDNGLDFDGNSFVNFPKAGTTVTNSSNQAGIEKMSMMGMDPEVATPLTKYLENKVNELNEELGDKEDENDQLCLDVEELQSMVRNLRRRQQSGSLDNTTLPETDGTTPFSTPPRSIHTNSESVTGASSDKKEMDGVDQDGFDVGVDKQNSNDDSRNVQVASVRHEELSTVIEELKEELGLLKDENRDLGDRQDQLEEMVKGLKWKATFKEAMNSAKSIVTLSKTESLEESEVAGSMVSKGSERRNFISTKNAISDDNSKDEIVKIALASRENGNDELDLTARVAELEERLRLANQETVEKDARHEQEISKLKKRLVVLENENALLYQYNQHESEPSDSESENSDSESEDMSLPFDTETIGDSEGEEKSVNGSRETSLGKKLSIVDQISGHESVDDGEGSVSTPYTARSLAVSIAHSSVQNESDSSLDVPSLDVPEHPGRERLSGESSSRGGNVSLSSWGALSFSRSPTKRSKSKRKGKRNPLLQSKRRGEDSQQPVENLERCSEDDNLKGAFENNATLNRGSDGPAVDNISNNGMLKIEQPTASIIDGKKSVNSSKLNPLAETARLLAASEEIIDIVGHTENLLGYELSDDVFEVLQNTALDMVRSGLSHTTKPESERPELSCQQVSGLIIDYSLFDAVEKIHGGTLQPEVVSSLRASAQWHIENCHNELQSANAMKERLEKELLDALIELSEQDLNDPFPEDLVNALKTAALSFGSLLIDKLDEANQHSISIDFQALEHLFKKAQDIYASSFPISILSALRDAGSILQSRLDGSESQCELDSTSEGIIEESLDASTNTTESEENLTDIDGDGYDIPLQEEDGPKSFKRKSVQRKPSMSDMSKNSTSEVSLDLFAVFDSTNNPPTAAMAASASASKKMQNETKVSTDAIPKAQHNQSFAHAMKKRPDRKRIARRSNSADGALETMSDALKMQKGIVDPSNDAGSDDLELIFKHATKGGVASASTISQHYTSDFSSTLMSSKISSTLMSSVEESADSFVSSNHIHRSRAAGAILTAIITDTEETYGVQVPPDLVRAIKMTIPHYVSDTFSIMSVVKPLHTDSFWEATEKIYGKPIQRDLIAAICLTFPSDDTQAKIIRSYSSPDSEDDTLHSNYTKNFGSGHLRNELLSPTKSISMHSDNSWSKLTVAFSEREKRSLETGKTSQTESEDDTDSRRTADLSARQRKRIAEAKFANSLADFDFDFSVREFFHHAKETLDMYSPPKSNNRKTHNEMESADKPNVDVSLSAENERPTESPLPDNLEDLYKTSYLQSPRVYDSTPPPSVSLARPPDFSSAPKETFAKRTSLAEYDDEEMPSDDPPEIRKAAIVIKGDPLLNVAHGKEDNLKNLYQKASAIQHSTDQSDADALKARTSQSAPNSYFVRSKAERSNSLDEHTHKTPLSSFLELNRSEMLERTSSGKEFLAISPVTEPTLGTECDPRNKEEVRAKLRSFNHVIPDLEEAIDHAADSDVDTTDLAGSVLAALEECSLDTAGELQGIIAVVEDKYGTQLSNELIEAINNSKTSKTGKLATMNDSNQSSFIMNSKSTGCEIANENSSRGPSDLHAKRIEDLSMSTKWTVQEYLDALIHNAECHLETPDQVQEIADDLCDAVRGVCARTKMMIVWEDLESILQKLCDGHDEDFWFEIQEAFFKAWEICADPKQRQKLATMGHASGYFSATTSASDGSISVLMNSSFDFDPLLDVIDEVRKLNNGKIPDELLEQMKEESLAVKEIETEEAGENLEFSTDLSNSKASMGEASGQSMSLDYSQSTVSSGAEAPSKDQIQNEQQMDDSGAFSAWTREEDDEHNASEHNQTQTLSKESVIGRSLSLSSQNGHSVTVNWTMGPSILREVRKVYPQPIPDELVSVLQNSPSLPYSMNSDEDISIILDELKASSGRQLGADLILGLREASVALRTPSNPRQARRFRLSRQNSAKSSSFRSRTSGMPSIQESGSTSSISPSSSTHRKTFSSESSVDTSSTRFMPPRRDSADPGLPETFQPEKIDPAVKITSTSTSVDGMAITDSDDVSEGSLGTHSDHSMNIPTIFTNPSPQNTPTSSGELHESTATQLVSNTYCRPAPLVPSDLATVLSNSMDSESIDDAPESNENSGSLMKKTLSEVSWEPAILSTREIPIDTKLPPSVDSAQTDDLDEMFRVAARGMR